MNDFLLWFKTGLEHIADFSGYDHIMFLMALCGIYEWKDWKKILVLVTAFTIGHSITLALSVFDIFRLPLALVEFLIPVTIFITCMNYLLKSGTPTERNMKISYGMALVFGFVHGMGFSTLLRSMLGKAESITVPLLFFNFGIEAGQVIIVVGIMIFSLLLTRIAGVPAERWKFYLSSAVSGIAFVMIAERLAVLFE